MIGEDFIYADEGYINKPYTDNKLSLEVLEECAFIESGLVAHGCLEKLDDYTKKAIMKYGRYLLKHQNKLSDEYKVQI
jgi:hypothetical protein